jgi:hypothetical protein|tara:strand:- start:404 stop:568 length:165 start_codon:yes stop_codon:yes gene_type:complete
MNMPVIIITFFERSKYEWMGTVNSSWRNLLFRKSVNCTYYLLKKGLKKLQITLG